MADDEPLEDARQVGMAAAAATARVVETVAREARDHAAQQRATAERSRDQQRAQDVLSGLSVRYDSPQRREAADSARETAGVPAEAREVQRTADLMRGVDPARAASSAQTKATTVDASPAPKLQRQKVIDHSGR